MNANGTAIRALRTTRKLSMAALAKAAGCSQPFLSRLERGEVGASAQTLGAIAKQLDVAVTDLIKGDTVTTTDLVDDTDLRLFTPEQVADLTNLSESWLRRRGGQRRIPCTYVSRQLLFSAEDIRELIEMHRIDPKTGLPRQQVTRKRAS
jgi:transcriptional regulator with XRE-family HTH domain